MPEYTHRDLWQIALEASKANQGSTARTVVEESTLVVCGAKGSGKSTLVDLFLDKKLESVPAPTIALEYSFGYKSGAKDIGHIYELGGGIWLTKLLSVPITASSLEKLSVVIVVDLSNPKELWDNLDTLLKSLNQYLEEAIKQAEQKNPSIRQQLSDLAWARMDENHNDKIQFSKFLTPFPVPLTFIGSMYDKFANFDPEQRKVISKTLRFVAHSNLANLIFVSMGMAQLTKRAKLLFAKHLFGGEVNFKTETDMNKPLVILCGQDSLGDIGPPPVEAGESAAGRSPLVLWRDAFIRIFPQTGLNNPSQVQNPAADPNFAELAVDNLRKQKDQELEIYRKQAERKSKEDANKDAQDIYN